MSFISNPTLNLHQLQLPIDSNRTLFLAHASRVEEKWANDVSQAISYWVPGRLFLQHKSIELSTANYDICSHSKPSLNLNDFCFWSSPAETKIEKMSEECKLKPQTKKRKRNPLLQTKNLELNVLSLKQALLNDFTTHTYIIVGERKAAKKAGGPISTRSKFIGVSRNGKSWQSLISIRKRKTYIGTFDLERHAGLAFDFYSILLCGLSAVTNFSYTREDVLAMLHNYERNGFKFDPTWFGKD